MKRTTEMLAAYLEAEVTPSEKAAVEAELADSAAARRRLAQLEIVRDALAAPIAEIEAADLTPRVMQAIEGDATRRRAGRRRGGRARAMLVAAAVAACAASAAAVVVILARPGADQFRSKAAAPAGDPAAQRWAGVQTYHTSGTGAPTRLGARLPAEDGLLFAYTNLGPRPFAYLMIFAVDARGAVRWCYPAYERPGDNPTSMPIHPDAAGVPLAEVIHHDLAGGPLEIRALFTMRPLGVAEVEAWVGLHLAPAAPLPWTDAFLQEIQTTVERRSAP